MAYDEKRAGRVRKLPAKRKATVEEEIFGGLARLLNGIIYLEARTSRSTNHFRQKHIRRHFGLPPD
jgi:hypothetical protein